MRARGFAFPPPLSSQPPETLYPSFLAAIPLGILISPVLRHHNPYYPNPFPPPTSSYSHQPRLANTVATAFADAIRLSRHCFGKAEKAGGAIAAKPPPSPPPSPPPPPPPPSPLPPPPLHSVSISAAASARVMRCQLTENYGFEAGVRREAAKGGERRR